MLVHALRAAMQGAPEWNDHNCKNEAIKRYEQLQEKCSISVPEKEDMLRTATGGQKSPQTVMQRVAPVRQGAQRAPIIIKPVPKVHQPSPVPRATQGYAGLRRANVTMPQSPPVTPQQKVTPWLASNGLEPVASQFRPVSPPVSRMPNPGSGRQWRHTHPVWWFPRTPPPVPFMGIKIVDLCKAVQVNNPICRWMFFGVMV
jgi:hypothetical protein